MKHIVDVPGERRDAVHGGARRRASPMSKKTHGTQETFSEKMVQDLQLEKCECLRQGLIAGQHVHDHVIVKSSNFVLKTMSP